MKVARYSKKAKRDLDEIAEYLAANNLDAAIRFCMAIDNEVQMLAEMPGMGPRRELPNHTSHILRSWPVKDFGNYVIIYQPTAVGIAVVRIFHGARDIDALLEEE